MKYVIVPKEIHHRIIAAVYQSRGYDKEESQLAASFCTKASWHGNHTHNGIKALEVDLAYGSGCQPVPGCVPGARIEKIASRFQAVERWNCHKKLGPAVAIEAMDTAINLADRFGIGAVSVDHAFHYLWGGGYVMDAAERGYIAFTTCTGAIPEMVPFGGKTPTLGTNPHSWAFPTTKMVGFPVVVDWATSVVSNGKIKQLIREDQLAPENAILDQHGHKTRDPRQFVSHLPMGGHKGYGLAMATELLAAYGGSSLPTIRCQPDIAPTGEKTTPHFFFMAIHPEAISSESFALGRDQNENVHAVIRDILGHGNSPPEGAAVLPGWFEHEAAQWSSRAGGLLFTEAEVDALAKHALGTNIDFDKDSFLRFDMTKEQAHA